LGAAKVEDILSIQLRAAAPSTNSVILQILLVDKDSPPSAAQTLGMAGDKGDRHFHAAQTNTFSVDPFPVLACNAR
jgi:hypothetical protein